MQSLRLNEVQGQDRNSSCVIPVVLEDCKIPIKLEDLTSSDMCEHLSCDQRSSKFGLI
jgi:hypothetical protein